MNLQENVAKLSLWQIRCSCMVNYVLNCIQWIWMLGIFPMESKTQVVVMEVVSQHLDQYRNNGLISKLHKILSGYIWACCLVWFLINNDFILDPEIDTVFNRHPEEFLCKFHEDLTCLDSPFVFYKWDICCWNKTVNSKGHA